MEQIDHVTRSFQSQRTFGYAVMVPHAHNDTLLAFVEAVLPRYLITIHF